ncbi:hypothetical protein GF391_00415 [Candidatus Uhrbacteria bacterium]|nr:hypothetical protein [Candidatus Uhrbacteria bacterium]
MRTSSLGQLVEDMSVCNQGYMMQGDFLVYSWGDAILLHDADLRKPNRKVRSKTCSAGSIFRANKERTRRTDGNTTHDIYEYGLYDAFRGASHAVANYGADGAPHTEDAEIEDTIQALHEYTTFLMNLGPLFAHVQSDLNVGMGDLAGSYRYKIDERKKRAEGHMWRGIMDIDSLGRRNPGAQRYAMYGAGTELRKRQDMIGWLSTHMDHKAVRCFRLINEHMEFFNDLWRSICTTDAADQLMAGQTTGHSMAMVHDFYIRASAIRALPFRRFAMHTAQDLLELRYALEKRMDEERIRHLTNRLREGTRWAFALDVLQMEIIFPLSELVYRLKRQEQKRRKQTKTAGKIKITYSMAPDEFDIILHKLFTEVPRSADEPDHSFETRLGKIYDQSIRSPKKERVQLLLGDMKQDIAEDDWIAVKNSLVDISRKI